jgi:hypothetical protein
LFLRSWGEQELAWTQQKPVHHLADSFPALHHRDLARGAASKADLKRTPRLTSPLKDEAKKKEPCGSFGVVAEND